MPDISTEVAIATTTLTSTASTITFSSIPNTYTDLRIVLTTTGNSPFQPGIRFNSDGAGSSNYSTTELWGDGSSPSSARETDTSYINAARGAVLSTTIPSLVTYDVFSYKGSTFKTVLSTYSGDNNGSGVVERTVGLWRSTSAIETVILMSANGSQTMTAGTTATLYGIL